MHSLEDGEVIIEGTKDLLTHVTHYYKNLFGPAPGNLFQISNSLWGVNDTVTAEDNQVLTKPFTVEEIKRALFSMDTNRAPGPDNIPIEFYQHCGISLKMIWSISLIASMMGR